MVDTTGAGDAYAAGFLYAYTQGRDLATAGRRAARWRASAAAARGCRASGRSPRGFVARRKERMMRSTAAVTSALLIAAVSPGAADVVDKGPAGSTLRIEQRTAATPAAAAGPSSRAWRWWWDGAHTYSGASKNLSIEARPGAVSARPFRPAAASSTPAIYVEPGQAAAHAGRARPAAEQRRGERPDLGVRTADGGAKITLTVATGGYLPVASTRSRRWWTAC